MSLSQPRFQVIPATGFTPQIGAFVAMLEHCRASVLDSVSGLTTEQLVHQHDATANPIGALLAHMAAVEWFYSVVCIEGAQPEPQEWGEWGPLLQLSPSAWAAVRDQPPEQHVHRLLSVRQRTLNGLAARNDEWLNDTFALPWTPEPANNRWALYHLLEDELNHRGQIRWLKSRLP